MFKQNVIADILAGLSVSFVAVALGAAFGTMSGRGAFAGMLAAAVIPIFASLLGGTRIQASGPTAPMTAVSALLVAHAYDYFPDIQLAEQFITLVFLLCGIFLVVIGVFGLGRFIRLVPNVVVLGFMNGIAALIWGDQVKKLIGLSKSGVLKGGLTINILIVIATFLIILIVPILLAKLKVRKSIRSFLPGVLVGILIMTFVTSLFMPSAERVFLGNNGNSFVEYFKMVKSYFPGWQILQMKYIVMAMPFALKLTLLAYLDSLLTALVIDQITHEKSKLNKELVAQGLANTASALVQGIPGAQATIRSVILIKEGAKTRLAGIMIGIFSLAGILLMKDYISLIASAVFIGVLLKAGVDVFDFTFPRYYLKERWYKSKEHTIQFGFIIYTTLVTIILDLNIAVLSGTVLFYLSVRYFHVVDFDPLKVEEIILAGEFSEASEQREEIIPRN